MYRKPRQRVTKVFISHSHAFANQHADLRECLDSVAGFDYQDLSIQADNRVHALNAGMIKAAINWRLQYCSIVLVVGGKFAAKRHWIRYELDNAKKWNKQVIVVRQRRQPEIPSEVAQMADATVDWDGNAIVAKIRQMVG